VRDGEMSEGDGDGVHGIVGAGSIGGAGDTPAPGGDGTGEAE
jgi:hypothetical protein